MNTTNILPPRFREKAFRRYEEDLGIAVGKYPHTHELDLTKYGLSAVTVAQRFRDAKKSFKDNNWHSMHINRPAFERCEGDLIVRETLDGRVKVGPSKEATLLEVQRNALAEFEVDRIIGPTIDMTDCDSNEVRFLCRLASQRALCTKVKISLDESLVETLYDSYDINLERQEDGFYILT